MCIKNKKRNSKLKRYLASYKIYKPGNTNKLT